MRFVLFSLVLSFMAAYTSPSLAQKLGKGDYAQCEVYDHNGDYVGLSNACLERKRARIRHHRDVHPETMADIEARARSQPYHCPHWANGGRGYNATFSTYGAPAQLFGTFDSTLNGRPCIPFATYNNYGYY